ncbi:Benzoylformate decarboxylase [Fulvia fulva]|uniref:Benzoylformate decarboxylase n=1 Tax=Passalora fulva TaxID=5499 RepID=A0A9Q8UVM7_PASFU|nr:Benzoylformate decarboxylase [Fulvia fulva]KAK4612235.1 Benzoylformate decarboxylase [Fulvia fulva]KAK4612485.1 Benzoylformate decarboxylase [Fulvia fulva]UJO24070.1 Benzoylformate decarboxylase [Fulvia fulva]WPV21011.1 Benzoylformate decarboxylase [Fulvia fulva]WPV35998.1 Benzoylformate decarboxylase [Fulvia fulva]
MAYQDDQRPQRLSSIDEPTAHSSEPCLGFGSDAIAEQLSRLNLDYIALVPGSSYRGLHDSLVNLKGNVSPEMLVCLHEEHAVSIAHGYAKLIGRPMAAAVHANVGLMHATMAIYNAWCDRVPIVVLGATGPLDASRRRPWIDWIHTAQDQGALIRPYVKFDDQPHSANAAIRSLVHATVAACSKPCAPTYVCLDLGLQEGAVDPATLHFPDTKRYVDAISSPGPSVDDALRVIAALGESKKPLFLLGRMSPSSKNWQERVELAEKFDARVVTDIKQMAPFPFPHQLQPAAPAVFLTPETSALVREADLILSFDWVDLAGNLKAAGTAEPQARVVHVSLDSALHNGWSKDHFAVSPADIAIHADVDRTLSAVLAASATIETQRSAWSEDQSGRMQSAAAADTSTEDILMPDLAASIYSTISADDTCLVRVPLGWSGADLRTAHALSFMGMDGGAGIGSGPGQVVGTALAIRQAKSSLIAVAVLGDGDFLMGSSALWTAARYRLPLLVIVANNGSYFNDEVHQERVANHRGRNVENKGIGMKLDNPQPDLHKIAEGLGCTVVRDSRVVEKSKLGTAIADAVGKVREGKCVVLDVRVLPQGYGSAMSEKTK